MESHKTLFHLRAWVFTPLCLLILTDTLSLGLALLKEAIDVLAHYIIENNTYSQNEYVNHRCLRPIAPCTWYGMEHGIVTVSFGGFYQAREHEQL